MKYPLFHAGERCPDCNRPIELKCELCVQLHPFAPANGRFFAKQPKLGLFLHRLFGGRKLD